MDHPQPGSEVRAYEKNYDTPDESENADISRHLIPVVMPSPGGLPEGRRHNAAERDYSGSDAIRQTHPHEKRDGRGQETAAQTDERPAKRISGKIDANFPLPNFHHSPSFSFAEPGSDDFRLAEPDLLEFRECPIAFLDQVVHQIEKERDGETPEESDCEKPRLDSAMEDAERHETHGTQHPCHEEQNDQRVKNLFPRTHP